VSHPVDPLAVAWAISRALESIGVVHTIGGSLAASFAGEPRSTVDIDIVAALEDFHVDHLVAALSGAFYIDEASVRRAIRERSSTNLIHNDTQLKVDLFVAGGTPLDTQQLARRRSVDVGAGRVLPVHPPEDILLQKLRWYQMGGRSSDRQWRDIQGIIRVQGARLDRDYLREHAPALGIDALLADALSESD
jgi:nucleotidyltransferase AbiEii toxin of type IV toxin-antitoxin system